jgi:hypothetical protein
LHICWRNVSRAFEQISGDDTGVSDEAPAFGAHEGTTGEFFFEGFVGFDGENFFEGVEFSVNADVFEIVDFCWLDANIMGTDFLANVTTEEPSSYFFAQVQGNFVAIFDGEVGDTLPRVDTFVFVDGLCWATIDAAAAAATRCGPLRWLVGCEFEICEDGGEKNIRTVFSGDDAGIFSDETQS